MGCEMKTYTDQHTAWRPDYPPVWHHFHGGIVYTRDPVWVGKADKDERDKNINAFTTGRNAIDKAMKQ